MPWSDAIAAVAEAFREVFGWKTGGREQSANQLRKEEERLNAAYREALSKRDYVLANDIYHDLRRVRDQAKSRFSKP